MASRPTVRRGIRRHPQRGLEAIVRADPGPRTPTRGGGPLRPRQTTAMADSSGFTPDELRWIADREFYQVKAGVTKKVRGLLERLHAGLREDLAGQDLLSPSGFDPARVQFVKGEHL